MYDGGKDSASEKFYVDKFFDAQILPDGKSVCVGQTGYSSSSSLLLILDTAGNMITKKTYRTNHVRGQYNSQSARSITIAHNGDFLVGGELYLDIMLMRLDSTGRLKWSTWYYDSLNNEPFLNRNATVNSITETFTGQIVCVAGDVFPNNDASPLDNYTAYLEFDSLGNKKVVREWDNEVGYKIAGFSLEQISGSAYLLSGNKNVYYLNSTGNVKWKAGYTFMIDGVGSVDNNVICAKQLRDGTLMVTGQAYEGNCWTCYQKLYYDAWWSPINRGGGSQITWDTA